MRTRTIDTVRRQIKAIDQQYTPNHMSITGIVIMRSMFHRRGLPARLRVIAYRLGMWLLTKSGVQLVGTSIEREMKK